MNQSIEQISMQIVIVPTHVLGCRQVAVFSKL